VSLLEVAECRALIDTHLSNDDLQAVIDRVEAEIAELVGAPTEGGDLTETLAGEGQELFLKRPIASVTSVTEYASLSDTTGTALTENSDFFVWGEQGRLTRLSGTWGAKVIVVYTPTDQDEKRKAVTIDLVRIVLVTSPLQSESVAGEYSATFPDNWEHEKAKVLRRLRFVSV